MERRQADAGRIFVKTGGMDTSDAWCASLPVLPVREVIPSALRLEPLHFEVLFCLAGMVTLTRRDGSVLRLGTRQVLLLTDISDLTDARVETGLKGVLVAVDARGARASLKAICDLLGGLALNTDQVRRWMVSRGGCAVEGPSRWSQAAFADLDRLPQSERARWCVWKSVELLYLLSARGNQRRKWSRCWIRS